KSKGWSPDVRKDLQLESWVGLLMARQPRTGISFPLQDEKLSTQASFVAELEQLGYSDVWASEAQDLDGFVPLALASQWGPAPRARAATRTATTRRSPCAASSCAAASRCRRPCSSPRCARACSRWPGARPTARS